MAKRNNSLALLEDVLSDDQYLSLILIIKRESPELNRLVKDISAAAADGAQLVKSLAKDYPGLDLKETGLPSGEEATRKSIAKAKRRELLHTKDAEFEFQLLLTQMEAMEYCAHLAAVAAENEPQPNRSRQLSGLSTQLAGLYERVLAKLRKTEPPLEH